MFSGLFLFLTYSHEEQYRQQHGCQGDEQYYCAQGERDNDVEHHDVREVGCEELGRPLARLQEGLAVHSYKRSSDSFASSIYLYKLKILPVTMYA